MKALLLSLSMLVSATVAAQPHRFVRHQVREDCGYWTLGIGTYSDWSELAISVTWCSPSGTVSGCTIAPDCYNGEHPPAARVGPGETAGTVFGYSPWSGFTRCEAITHAEAFVCPVSMNSYDPPDTYGGPDTQTP